MGFVSQGNQAGHVGGGPLTRTSGFSGERAHVTPLPGVQLGCLRYGMIPAANETVSLARTGYQFHRVGIFVSPRGPFGHGFVGKRLCPVAAMGFLVLARALILAGVMVAAPENSDSPQKESHED